MKTPYALYIDSFPVIVMDEKGWELSSVPQESRLTEVGEG